MSDLRARALALCKPPFRFDGGYIWDSDRNMVADDGYLARVRGWGRIGKEPDGDQLQDEIGAIIAEALTAYWTRADADAKDAARWRKLRGSVVVLDGSTDGMTIITIADSHSDSICAKALDRVLDNAMKAADEYLEIRQRVRALSS